MNQDKGLLKIPQNGKIELERKIYGRNCLRNY